MNVVKYIPPVKTLLDIVTILQREGMQVGVELGVQRGHFAAQILSGWLTCKRYYLVDLWAPQHNYKDGANVGRDQQDQILKEAQANLQSWRDKLVWLRNYTTKAVFDVQDEVDFVYVDASEFS
jgi:hypothetical protein